MGAEQAYGGGEEQADDGRAESAPDGRQPRGIAVGEQPGAEKQDDEEGGQNDG